MADREARHLVADASCAMATRMEVDDLLAEAAGDPGVPVQSLNRLAEMVNRGQIARAAAALDRLRGTGTVEEGP